MTESEFREYLATITPADRKKFVEECVSRRGETFRDICEKDYLLDSELKALAYQRAPKSNKSKLEQLKDERYRLIEMDNRMYSDLVQNCNRPELHCTVYSASSFGEDFSRLRNQFNELNSDPEYKASFGLLESKTIAWVSVTRDIDNALIPKVAPLQNPWDSLPSRANSASSNQDNGKPAAESNGFKDPYAGVSDELNQEKIDKHAWNIGAITGAISAAGQVLQAEVAHDSPEAASVGREILGSIGLGEYAPSGGVVSTEATARDMRESEICPLSEPYKSQCEARNGPSTYSRNASSANKSSNYAPPATPPANLQVPTFTPVLPEQQIAGQVDSANYSAMNCSERELAIKSVQIPANASPSSALETVMWISNTAMQMFDDGCPGITEADRDEHAKAYQSSESACQAIRTDPSSCKPAKHF
ncbi:hypothetical protein NCG89_12535 [Spongiibacter taiwanensis]|uniref:hypothetical protein n=1 Tax=Spongiibacter taiwanensis TaxID=1748242 RepID=UPI002035104C|nr:hypothetical protein [Spongiibacter taiwanensis]USA42351.1 hypothetical protein NCG89_12535 [Spongiibacter taiwanensis]